jgi:putative transposase
LPGDLEQRIGEFVDYYNHERDHESLNNLTPTDVYCGRGQQILDRREEIKLDTLAMRRKMHYDNQMKSRTLMS